jgi:hypothetical protein
MKAMILNNDKNQNINELKIQTGGYAEMFGA